MQPVAGCGRRSTNAYCSRLSRLYSTCFCVDCRTYTIARRASRLAMSLGSFPRVVIAALLARVPEARAMNGDDRRGHQVQQTSRGSGLREIAGWSPRSTRIAKLICSNSSSLRALTRLRDDTAARLVVLGPGGDPSCVRASRGPAARRRPAWRVARFASLRRRAGASRRGPSDRQHRPHDRSPPRRRVVPGR
jgi:hypothetical protein